ncbi:hypothetical protein ACOMHN_048004 [Nucella lapillus]
MSMMRARVRGHRWVDHPAAAVMKARVPGQWVDCPAAVVMEAREQGRCWIDHPAVAVMKARVQGRHWVDRPSVGGGGGGHGGGGASSELYVDKAVKFMAGGLQMVLGIALVILTHALSDICEDYRIFSFLVLFQSLWLLLVLLLWFWCYGQDLCSHVQEILQHVNHLTYQYQRYGDGVVRGGIHRQVTEETLHSDLGSYLEYLLHVLMVKGEQLYRRHLFKWVTVLGGCVIWLVGMVVLIATCGLPVQLYMRVLILVPVLILLGVLALVTFHLIYDLCLPRKYQSTFFYQAVPGTMDARISRAVSESFNPRCAWLVSRHCWQNASALCANAGLSKALARKYCYVSRQHRADRWRDQHFPNLRSDQVERFMFNSEQFALNSHQQNSGCCHSLLWCCLESSQPGPSQLQPTTLRTASHYNRGSRRKMPDPNPRKQKIGPDGHQRFTANSEASSGLRVSTVTFEAKAEDGYMTPNLFVRKLAKEAATPEQMLDEEISRRSMKKSHHHHHKLSPRDDLYVASLGPQRFPANTAAIADAHGRGMEFSRDDTEVDYGGFYQPHETDPHRLQREYDPLTYGVRMSVKKEMAKDMKVWK